MWPEICFRKGSGTQVSGQQGIGQKLRVSPVTGPALLAGQRDRAMVEGHWNRNEQERGQELSGEEAEEGSGRNGVPCSPRSRLSTGRW